MLGRRSIDLSGMRFGRLTAIKIVGRKHKYALWECKCDCGIVISVISQQLNNGQKSCGCLRREQQSTMMTRHGMFGAPEYRTWTGMIQRCTNPKTRHFEHYGGRGIKVCDRWLESFENFYEDMGKRPADGLSIDRINNDGNYEPGNCRWADRFTQRKNRRPGSIRRCGLCKTVGHYRSACRQWTGGNAR